MKENLKNNAVILIAVLLLIAAAGTYVFLNQELLFTGISEETTVIKESENAEAVVKTEEPEPDCGPVNGTWESEKQGEDRYLCFEITYPDVMNSGKKVGTISDSKDSRYQYLLKLNEDHDGIELYISDLKDDKAKIWYQDNNGNYTYFYNLTRKAVESSVIAETEKPSASSQSGKPAASGNSGSQSGGHFSSGNSSSSESTSSSNRQGHYEERRVLVKEAYDEKVLVKKGACRDVLVQEAYDSEETVYGEGAYYGADMIEVYVCNGCGAVFYDSGINDHIGTPEHPGWHNDYIASGDPYWHNVSTSIVHHDAVYETRCEPDEYETVHHDAMYETQKVWVEN